MFDGDDSDIIDSFDVDGGDSGEVTHLVIRITVLVVEDV